MTVRSHGEARRHGRRRFWAEARKLARHQGCTLNKAAKILRGVEERVCQVARGEMTMAELVAATRAEVRKALHDGRAVRP